MKAIVKTTQGVVLKEKEIPRLRNTNDVLIKVLLTGLCRTDLYAAQNKLPMNEGTVLGHEFTGIVEQVGPVVNSRLLNQRVGVLPIFTKSPGVYSMLGVDLDGSYADYVVVPDTHVYPLPGNLSMEEAAFLEPVAACLAVVNAEIKPQQRGLIYGNNRIAELTRRILVSKGFTQVTVAPDGPVAEPDNAFDFIVETTASTQAFEEMVRLTKPQGMIVLKSRPYMQVSIPLTLIVRKEIKLMGVHYGSFEEAIELLASRKLVVDDLFGSTYSFAEAVPILLGERVIPEENKLFFKP
jgi:threonine dehydrogenase-like Zn-dependent dehydrogenase